MTIMKTRSIRAAVLALVAAVALSACSGGGDDAPAAVPAFDGSHVEADAFAAAVAAPSVTVIDVRTPEEFAAGHIPGAVNLNVEGPDFAQQVAALDQEADYAVYCRSGNRSRAAIEYLTMAGVTHTVGLEGGIGAWEGDVTN